MKYRNSFFNILVILFTTLLVGCTCLPFSSPSSKTPINGAISYSDILTYIGVNASGNPKWDGWVGIANQDQTLNYSISPDSHYVKINEDTGEITVLANALFSNNFTVTATGHGEFQDSISTELSIKVRPPFLYNVYNIKDGGSLEIDGPYDFASIEIEGTTYLYVVGYYDDGLNVFSVNNDGSLVNVQSIPDTDDLKLRDVRSVSTAIVGSNTYLFTSTITIAPNDIGLNVFSVNNDGTLVNIASAGNNADLELYGIESTTTAKVGENTYLFVARYYDDGISVFSVNEDGNLDNVTNISDNVYPLNLDRPTSVTTVQVGGVTYLYVAGWEDDGVSVFTVREDGFLVNVFNIKDDGDDGVMKLDGIHGITTAVVGGTIYLFTAGDMDHGVSVFSVEDDGTLVNVFNVGDDNSLELSGARDVTTAVVGGTTYLFVAAYNDHGVSVFSVNNDGSLVNVANVTGVGTDFFLSRRVFVKEVGGIAYLFAASYGDDGISVFSINP